MAVKFKKGIDLQGQRAIGASDPTTATDLVTKQYADRLIQGVSDLKDPVRGTTTANIAITTLINALSHDGVVYATGDRILVKNNTDASENGIYVIGASGTGTRAADFNVSDEATRGASTTVLEGTTKGTGTSQANPVTYVLITPDPIVLATTSLTFAPIGGTSSSSTADGLGLELSGSQFALELDGTTLQKGTSGLKVNEAVVVKKFAADCVVTTNPQTFTHGLGTNDVTVDVWESDERVFPDITKGAGTVIVDWGGAPTSAQYRVVIHG